MSYNRISVLGAYGFVGSYILKELLNKGFFVKAGFHSRKIEISNQNLISIKINLNDLQSIEDLLKDTDAVIYLPGIIYEVSHLNIFVIINKIKNLFSKSENNNYSLQKYNIVHIEGVKNTISVAEKLGIKRFILMSAIGANLKSRSNYHISKAVAENLLKETRLIFTIFRPSIIFGKEDSFINMFINIIKRFRIVLLPFRGLTKFQPVWVQDVANIFINSINNENTFNKTYELGGAGIFNLKEIINLICDFLNIKPLIIKPPLIFFKVIAFFSKYLLKRPLITKDQLIMLRENNIVNPELAFKYYKDFRSFKETLDIYKKY